MYTYECGKYLVSNKLALKKDWTQLLRLFLSVQFLVYNFTVISAALPWTCINLSAIPANNCLVPLLNKSGPRSRRAFVRLDRQIAFGLIEAYHVNVKFYVEVVSC